MFTVHSLPKVKALIRIPSDKSISHRALLISSLSKGTICIDNLLYSDDTVATLQALKKIGIPITTGDKVIVSGCQGWYPRGSSALHLQESGTSIRLLCGILAAQKHPYALKGAPSLLKRPMSRVTVPLRMMGADIRGIGRAREEYPPLTITPVPMLKGIDYRMPIQSAQVKSALLFAALYAQGKTVITQPAISRDHTERMLSVFGADIVVKGNTIIAKRSSLKNVPYLYIPGDISSAAFFIALGVLLKKSEILIEKVGVNPTRTGILRVLKRMGAEIKLFNKNQDYFEPYADILVGSSRLKACTVNAQEIPLLIDELPMLFLCAARARGTSYFRGVEELRIKETDRIESMFYNLREMGVHCGSVKDGTRETVYIEGAKSFKSGIHFKSFSDHRTAMSCIIAGLISAKDSTIDDVRCINKSFPEFLDIVKALYRL